MLGTTPIHVHDRAAVRTKLAPHVIGARGSRCSFSPPLHWGTASPGHDVRIGLIPVGKWSQEAYEVLLVVGKDPHPRQAEDPEPRWCQRFCSKKPQPRRRYGDWIFGKKNRERYDK